MATSFSLCDSGKLVRSFELITTPTHSSRSVSVLPTRVISIYFDSGAVMSNSINSFKEQLHNSLSK